MLPTIAKLEVHRLNAKMIKESWDDDYVWPASAPSLLVKVTDSAGNWGVGEVTSQPWYYGETAEKIISALELYRKALFGLSVGAIAEAHRKMEAAFSGGVPASRGARSAVDIALHDLLGKVLGVPVHTLLGGALRTEFEMLANLYHKTPESMAKASKELVDEGYCGLKIKVGDVLLSQGWSRKNLEAELGLLEVALEAVPSSVYIDADANQGWRSPKWTVDVLRRFERFDNLSIEQPLRHADLEGAAFVREHAHVPIILDESIWSPEAMSQVIRMNACDRIVLKLGRVGGFHPAAAIVAMCEAANIGVSVDTSPYNLVGDTASCHIAATVPTAYPVDCDGHLTFFSLGDQNPFEGGVSLTNGKAHLPDAPGLGIEVDWGRLGEPV
ncbi:mandelate racemase/muconate lactonizing enzyme family protein [Rhizobium laguerreae]|uniref:mandelate racemase/muconate lactonizing enzyme family protein n=1 Tax=Rhizobium laguerreae TaxID=1076926 RepID=UPI001C90DD70|nr:mandelate racemase/muconate lactonizing enzyme family protein [Rhizobium laguerreae]MBY3381818.1 mandelate racemase/muconate lactonizing enzyme family protein [Rhizobium laguerreae]